MLNATYYGHACFSLTDGDTRLLIDPYLTGNPLAPITPKQAEADYLLVTHGHGDHVGDAPAIAARTGAPVITPVEIGAALFGKKVKTLPCNIGGRLALPFGAVKLIPAVHGSGVPGALACGFIVELGGKKVCHLGDTALTKDLELLAEEGIDLLLVPIGDVYTMGPADALRAVKMIRPGLTVPMHYNTFPLITQDPDAFAAAAEAAGFPAKVLAPGETLSL